MSAPLPPAALEAAHEPHPPSEPLQLGIDGFGFEDLYSPHGLRRLNEAFDAHLEAADASLWRRFSAYRAAPPAGLSKPEVSSLLIDVAAHLSRFVARLFGLETPVERLRAELTTELSLFEFKREFIGRRVFKKGATNRPTRDELPALDARMRCFLAAGFGSSSGDPERQVVEAVLTLMRLERLFSGQGDAASSSAAHPQALRERWEQLKARVLAHPSGRDAFPALAAAATHAADDHGPTDEGELGAVRDLLDVADRWTYARVTFRPEEVAGFPTHHLPAPIRPDALVPLHRPSEALPELAEGPPSHRRRRDGFKLTDRRAGVREVMDQVEYCVLCHERDKDSCSKGFLAKDGGPTTYKPNALGTPLTGCPLDERISEMHALKARGDSVGALAMVMLDNPMCPGTGHRICNDCMKACIFQKQEPVNIPQIETSVLTDVLALPFGFELYGLFTRWNPLSTSRPYALPTIGKKVLIVGMGPAGYSLANALLNEGLAVTGVDGLKLEPFPDALLGRGGHPLTPIRDFGALARELDERAIAGFGGVSEYGITVRWDKNFLTLIHLTLARRANMQILGGVRFGGTFTLEDAWELGFDHVAIAAGAGKPTLIPMKNGLLQGIRKASDFLMALQLSGAFRKESLSNLQVQLPAIVIGGGLTAIDTATELMAYYPVQVEKVLERYEALDEGGRAERLLRALDPAERELLEQFLAHGREVRAERARARAANEPPNLAALVRAWGGVALCYRRSLTESPAYRLNHEEVHKALEEGITILERLTPLEAVPDARGAVKAVRFERGEGQVLELPARTVCVAAGTSPNVSYEREYPGTFELDDRRAFFKCFSLVEREDGGFELAPAPAHGDLGRPSGFFTSYQRGDHFVTFYGDNHPTYAGSVVKAMASAKDGAPEVTRLFARHRASLDLSAGPEQSARDVELRAFFQRIEDAFTARVVAINRLTPTIVEVVVRAPLAARKFQPGQFYRLQNFERFAPRVDSTALMMEGLALTGAWVDQARGLLSTVVLEMGTSSRLCATLRIGEQVVLMGPTGAPTEIPRGETVLLAGGGLGNAVLFSIGQALKAAGSTVLYFAGYRTRDDCYKMEQLEAAADQIVWSVDSGAPITPRRPQDASFTGNIVQAMLAYAEGRLATPGRVPLAEVGRIIAIGSDRMMRAVKEARHSTLRPHLNPSHEAIGSINSPMQCMMKEICAQCLQRHVDPVTGKETFVYSCFNQDQKLDHVDFVHLDARLRANSVLEKLSNVWLDHLFDRAPTVRSV